MASFRIIFSALKVLDVVSLPSLLIGIYGTHILVTTVSSLDELMPYRYTYVFRLLDFYFMFFGIQHPIFDLLARAGVFGCGTILPALETAFCNFFCYPIFLRISIRFLFSV
uniref:Uncharacterized protein n=1 Tax=Parascaris equorum TaxID=6256 RepID=A0A914SAY0_PAREQ